MTRVFARLSVVATTVLRVCTTALTIAISAPAGAERTDRDKPTNVESDRLHYDEPKQTTVFTGRVVLTKGTLIIRGDQMVLHQQDNNQQSASTTGKPASFRQKRDGPGEQYINGTARQIDYDSRSEKVTMTGVAVLTRLECGRPTDQITGAVVVYDGRAETINVDGRASPAQVAKTADPNGRVRVTIQPRSDAKGSSGGAPVPCPPSEPTVLQPDHRLGPPRGVGAEQQSP